MLGKKVKKWEIPVRFILYLKITLAVAQDRGRLCFGIINHDKIYERLYYKKPPG